MTNIKTCEIINKQLTAKLKNGAKMNRTEILIRQAKTLMMLIKQLKKNNIECEHYILEGVKLVELAQEIEQQEKTITFILKVA